MAADLTPAVVLVHRTNARNEQRPIDRVCDERKRLFGRQQNHRTVTDLHWSDRGMSLASIVRPDLAVGLYVARASGVRISMEMPWRCNRGYVAGRWVWSNAAAKSRVRGWKLCPAACLRQSVGPHLRRPHPLPPARARPAAKPGRRMRRRRRRRGAWW